MCAVLCTVLIVTNLWSHLTLHPPWTLHTPRARHATWELLAPSYVSSGHVWCHACRRSAVLITTCSRVLVPGVWHFLWRPTLLRHSRAAVCLHSTHVRHVPSSSCCPTTSFRMWAVGALFLHRGLRVGRSRLGGGRHLASHARGSRTLPALWHRVIASTAVHVHAGAWAGTAHHPHWHHVGTHVGHLTWHLHPLTNRSLELKDGLET